MRHLAGIAQTGKIVLKKLANSASASVHTPMTRRIYPPIRFTVRVLVRAFLMMRSCELAIAKVSPKMRAIKVNAIIEIARMLFIV